MTNNLKLHQQPIEQSFYKKDFDTIFSIFTKSSLTSNDLFIFYKQKNGSRYNEKSKLFSLNAFWQSQLPHLFLRDILTSELKIDFFEKYFSSNEFCNHELNKHLSIIAKEDYLKYFKLWKVYTFSKFSVSFSELSLVDSDIEKTLKEINIIINAEAQILKEEKADEPYILQFDFGDIILGLTLAYYEFKQTESVTNNKSWQAKIESSLVEELNYIISLFRQKSTFNINFQNNEELQKHFLTNEAPHHILGKKNGTIFTDPKFRLISQLFQRLIDRNARRGVIEHYLTGFSDFLNLNINPAPLKTNQNFKKFRINDAKSSPEEFYFSGFTISSLFEKIPSRTDISGEMKAFEFYGIPNIITYNNYQIEIKKVFQLLKYFSVYKGPCERHFLPDGSFSIMNQGDSLFANLFGTNESITVYDSQKLVQGISKYFNWTEYETYAILNFLTLDFSIGKYPSTWANKPFLKFNNQIIWLGSFLKDRRWDNVILNKLKIEPEYSTIKNEISKKFEQKIELLFKSKSFKTICSERFTSKNGQSGDFDVLAYKDNHLFVCEAKTSIRSNDFLHAKYLEEVRLEGCAADQINKSLHNINENWEQIRIKLGIENKVKLENLIIVPLIITDYFEGDLQLYKNSIIKTSLLELDVILNNKKKDLLEMSLEHKKWTNIFNPDIKVEPITISDWDLWDGKREFEVELILKNLKQNSIWKEIETLWKFEDENYKIAY